MSKKIIVPQSKYTPPTLIEDLNFPHRYAYQRSFDSKKANSPGQDYLSFKYNEAKYVFALCDGVSQSFVGELGAKILGKALISWLWNEIPETEIEVQEKLSFYLNSLVDAATTYIENYSFPEETLPIVKEVLNEKRETTGSESTFICGRIDLSSEQFPEGRVVILWLGDSYGKLWKGEDNVIPEDKFITTERWSTKLGLVEDSPHIYCSPLKIDGEIIADRLIVSSDGIPKIELDGYILQDARLSNMIDNLHHSPSSDDISYLEIWISKSVPKELLSQNPVNEPYESQVTKKVYSGFELTWKKIPKATHYEIEYRSDSKSHRVKTVDTKWLSPPLESGKYNVRLRGIQEKYPGKWSQFKEINVKKDKKIEPIIVSEPSQNKYFLFVGIIGVVIVALLSFISFSLLLPSSDLNPAKTKTSVSASITLVSNKTPKITPKITKTLQVTPSPIVITKEVFVENPTSTPWVVTKIVVHKPKGRTLSPSNCRLGPGNEYEIIRYISQGTEVIPKAQGLYKNWWYIQTPGIEKENCWIWIGALDVQGEISELPIITPAP